LSGKELDELAVLIKPTIFYIYDSKKLEHFTIVRIFPLWKNGLAFEIVNEKVIGKIETCSNAFPSSGT